MIKPCARHASDITDALRKKGMWQLVATQPDEVKRRTQLWLEGHASRQEVDPLIITLLEITKKAGELGMNVHAMQQSPLLEFCMLCEVEKLLRRPTAGADWIDNCTDAVHVVCLANGLVKPPH